MVRRSVGRGTHLVLQLHARHVELLGEVLVRLHAHVAGRERDVGRTRRASAGRSAVPRAAVAVRRCAEGQVPDVLRFLVPGGNRAAIAAGAAIAALAALGLEGNA